MASFGEMVKAGTRARGLTQRQLADLLDVAHTEPSHWWHNRRAPGWPMVVRIAEVLELDLAELVRARAELDKEKQAKSRRRAPEASPGAEAAAERAAEAATEAARALGESPQRRRRGGGRPQSR